MKDRVRKISTDFEICPSLQYCAGITFNPISQETVSHKARAFFIFKKCYGLDSVVYIQSTMNYGSESVSYTMGKQCHCA